MAERGVNTVSRDWITPFGADGFVRITGLTLADFTFTITSPAGEAVTVAEIADDDRADSAILRGQILFKEAGASGNYRLRWRIGTDGAGASLPGTWWLTADYTARTARWEIEHDAVHVPSSDPAATEKIVLKARSAGGVGVPHAAYDVVTSAGVRLLTGFTNSAGDADLFLPVGTGYKVRLSAADWQFAEASLAVVAGANPDLTITASAGALVVADLTATSAKDSAATVEVEFRKPVSGALIDPSAVSQVQILDLDGVTVLQTITSGSITNVSTGRYRATALGANLDAAGVYFHRWTYTIDAGGGATMTTRSWVVTANVAGGLDADDLCTVTGTFTDASGGPAANVAMIVRYKGTVLVDGRLVVAAGLRAVTDADGKVSTKLAKGAATTVEMRTLGIQRTVTIPNTATADWGALLV